jgi:hypothetical protein
MWAKDAYQEQMLGYLGAVQTEIEQGAHFRLQWHDLNELYTDLDIASERLWRLIEARDRDWEDFRPSLETSCDDLLRAFYSAPRASTLMFSVSLPITEPRERRSLLWQPAEMLP